MLNSYILVINPGSTSTKIGVYNGSEFIFLKNLKHSTEELKLFSRISDQFEFRRDAIIGELNKSNIDLNLIKIIIGRGGLIKPIESGVYLINDVMLHDLRIGFMGEHACNLGGLIAFDIANSLPDSKAYIADPVVVNELQEVAMVSGHPKLEKVSIFHALNQKAVANRYAKAIGKKYETLNLIVAHLGGGITVGAHLKGKVIDVNNGLDGEGPMTPERTGTCPAGALAKLCFSGNYTHEQVKKMITGEGGMVAYLGTNDGMEMEKRANSGDKLSSLIRETIAYQTGKEIGAKAAALKGKVDCIIITGGLAHNQFIINYIKEMISFIAPVEIYPGEDEMIALAENAVMVLNGEVTVKEYS